MLSEKENDCFLEMLYPIRLNVVSTVKGSSFNLYPDLSEKAQFIPCEKAMLWSPFSLIDGTLRCICFLPLSSLRSDDRQMLGF